jgi:hypothetical protein
MRRQTSDNADLSYLGNPKIKRDGVEIEFTEHEVKEYLRCMSDIVYFAKKYVKVIHLDRGICPFEPYPYQVKMLDHLNNNRFSIILAPRQSGKSISSIVWLLHYAVFNSSKTIAILANKGATSREMLARFTLALENLPFFLQPGCKTLNKGSIKFSNETAVIAAATSSASIRGLSVNVLLLDEFSFVERAEEFYTSTYPVISSGKDVRVIITSTPNGTNNLFYRMWQNAMSGKSTFAPMRVRWWDVPGRDEKWKAETIANTSQRQFDQEFGAEFLGSSSTLVDAEILSQLSPNVPLLVQRKVRYYREPIEGHDYVMTVDVSKGRGQDASTFTVFDTSELPYKQVATFSDNMISPLIYPDIIVRVAKMYNEALIIIENNDVGAVVANAIYYEYEYENTFVESSVKAGGIGVTMTKRVKRIGCSNLKDLIEMGKLEIADAETISELSSFEEEGSSFKAKGNKHDDLVMNCVMFAWFISTDGGGYTTIENLRDLLYSDRLKEMEEDVVPFGISSRAETPSLPPEILHMIEERKAWAI